MTYNLVVVYVYVQHCDELKQMTMGAHDFLSLMGIHAQGCPLQCHFNSDNTSEYNTARCTLLTNLQTCKAACRTNTLSNNRRAVPKYACNTEGLHACH